MPSEKQIDAEIKKLKTLKPLIPEFTFFRDNNYEKIKAQIEVLKEGLTEEDVYDRFEDSENPDKTADLVGDAIEAALWLIGEAEKDAPSKGWKELTKAQNLFNTKCYQKKIKRQHENHR